MKLFGKLLWIGVLLVMVVLSVLVFVDMKLMLKIGYVEGWDDSVVMLNVVVCVIEKKFGYEVKFVLVVVGIMWQGVVCGDFDVMLFVWLLVMYGLYWDEYKVKVVDFGVNFFDVKIGLIVFVYVKVKSIDDLNVEKGSFGGWIVGIDVGVGVMCKIDDVIKSYGLNYMLMLSLGSVMMVELLCLVGVNKLVIVMGWVLYWMFVKWKLCFFEDLKKVFGGVEYVDSVVNLGFEIKVKLVVVFLKKFQWKLGEIDSVMLVIQNGLKLEVVVDVWIVVYVDCVNLWMEGVQ